MFDPSKILAWLEENVQSMRQSRRKTLAVIVEGAMKMQGSGVLALGRAMGGETAAKHCIKRRSRGTPNAVALSRRVVPGNRTKVTLQKNGEG